GVDKNNNKRAADRRPTTDQLRKSIDRSTSIAMAPPPSPLTEELIEEILVRFPADDPASLVGAALVCKPWCRLVCSQGFRRRFTEFHRRRTPVLGFFCRVRPRPSSSEEVRFVPTSPSFRRLPHAMMPNWHPVDALHGRVLLYHVVDLDLRLIVCNPITGQVWRMPPTVPQLQYKGWNAALLCSSAESFRVVVVATTVDGFTSARIYSSSEHHAWGMPIASSTQRACVSTGGCVARNNDNSAVYFMCRRNYGILEYDSCKQQLSFIGLPSQCELEHKCIALMTAEDGGLGFAMIDVHRDSKLFTWSRRDHNDPCNSWTQEREFDLDELFPLDVLFTPRAGATRVVAVVNAFTDVFIGTIHGIFTVDLNLGKVTQIHHSSHSCDIRQVVPYAAFCTPVVGNCLHMS
ncbi:hypothetical protein EJB05_10307, partial [Eragrostis curvula]